MPTMKVNLFKSSSNAASRQKPAARNSIRGKISGPIPIHNPTEDDEFPIRQPGTSFVAPKPPSDDEFPIRNPGHTPVASPPPPPEEPADVEQQTQQTPPAQAEPSGVSDSRTDVGQAIVPEPPSNPPPPPPTGVSPPTSGVSPTSGSGSGTSPKHRRANPSSTLRYSQISAASTGNTAPSGSGPPQRKQSTLRNALSKLFGRKKKTGSQSSADTERMSRLGASQHRSDPSALGRSKENEPKRSASLPLTEYDRALRSHSIGPDDITAIESARNSLQADAGPSRRRAATTTSRIFSHPRRGELGGWGLSPRPASVHGRGSHLISLEGEEDPSQIGRAITSDSLGDSNHRRRSRSLSGLHDVVDGRPAQRRRSDEIRYWRESYDPGFMSPLSSGNEGDNGEYGDNDDTGAASMSIPESPAVDHPPKTPPQPFVFGSIATMNEMAGMKITHAASIDSRIGSLESRMHKLERVVDQLCHSVPGFKGPLAEIHPETVPRSVPPIVAEQSFAYTTAAPPMIPAIYQAISADLKGASGSSRYSSSRHSAETDSYSHMSFGEGQTYIGSLHPPSSSATQAQSIPAISPANRPTSTSTVRGATSLPALGGRVSGELDLLSQIESERAARQALEAQVKKLSDRVNSLSTTMFALVRDPTKSRSQERLAPAPSTTSASTPTAVPASILVPPLPKPRSVFEDDSDFEDKRGGHIVSPSEADDDTPSEAFQTPREDRQVYGAFGEELREEDDDPKRKKAARTLSLSQLTLGKEARI